MRYINRLAILLIMFLLCVMSKGSTQETFDCSELECDHYVGHVPTPMGPTVDYAFMDSDTPFTMAYATLMSSSSSMCMYCSEGPSGQHWVYNWVKKECLYCAKTWNEYVNKEKTDSSTCWNYVASSPLYVYCSEHTCSICGDGWGAGDHYDIHWIMYYCEAQEHSSGCWGDWGYVHEKAPNSLRCYHWIDQWLPYTYRWCKPAPGESD